MVSDDLVQRLRHDKDCLHTALCEEAADRIDALEAALREIATVEDFAGDIAHRALEGKP